MKKLIFALPFFLISCTSLSNQEIELIKLHEKYIALLKNYNSELLKISKMKKFSKSLKAKVKKLYHGKNNLKLKIDKVIHKLKNEVGNSAFKKIKKFRKIIRELLIKTIDLREKIIKIKGTGDFFEKLLLKLN